MKPDLFVDTIATRLIAEERCCPMKNLRMQRTKTQSRLFVRPKSGRIHRTLSGASAGAAWEFMDLGAAPHDAGRGPLSQTLQVLSWMLT
jgi:hypothetical protein